MLKKVLFVSVISIMLSSCATLFGGNRYVADVVVPGREDVGIYVNGKQVGYGSATFEQKRKQRLEVTLEKDGCTPQKELFSIETRPALIVCDLVGIVGLVVDFGTGAIYRPELRVDPRVEKVHYDRFRYNVFYEGCKSGD